MKVERNGLFGMRQEAKKQLAHASKPLQLGQLFGSITDLIAALRRPRRDGPRPEPVRNDH